MTRHNRQHPRGAGWRLVAALVVLTLLVACASDDAAGQGVDQTQLVQSVDGFVKDVAVLGDGRLVTTAVQRDGQVQVGDPAEPDSATILEADDDPVLNVPFFLEVNTSGSRVLGRGERIGVWQASGELIDSLPSGTDAIFINDDLIGIARRDGVTIYTVNDGGAAASVTVPFAADALHPLTVQSFLAADSTGGGLVIMSLDGQAEFGWRIEPVVSGDCCGQILDVSGDRVAVVESGELRIVDLGAGGDSRVDQRTSLRSGIVGWDGAFVNSDTLVLVPVDDGVSGPVTVVDLAVDELVISEVERETQVPVAVAAAGADQVYIAVQYRVTSSDDVVGADDNTGIERWSAAELKAAATP